MAVPASPTPAAPDVSAEVLSATRITLRPLATPLPLGFLALSFATGCFAVVQLGWIAPTQGSTIALGVLVLTVPLQFLASVMGFLARDPVAATGMGILSGTWAGICLTTLTSPPGATSPGLGVLLLAAGACLLVPAAAAYSKVIPALVIATSAVRFAVTGIAQLDGGQQWLTAAGWVGLALALLSFYVAFALELEGTTSHSVLPLGRRGVSLRAVDGRLGDQVAEVASEPGVRQQL